MALFTWLGFWQLDRMQQKQAMLDATATVVQHRDAVPLASASDPRRAGDYDWAAGSGRFANAPAILLDNQQRDGRHGVRAYALFQPETGASPLLVELGWLALPGDRKMPRVEIPQGRQRIAGLLAPPPSGGIARAEAVPQADGNLLTVTVALPMLRQALQSPQLAPRLLKLDPTLPLGYPRDLDILPNTLPPEQHLGYAVTWFGLALTVLVTALVLGLRKPRKPAASG